MESCRSLAIRLRSAAIASSFPLRLLETTRRETTAAASASAAKLRIVRRSESSDFLRLDSHSGSLTNLMSSGPLMSNLTALTSGMRASGVDSARDISATAVMFASGIISLALRNESGSSPRRNAGQVLSSSESNRSNPPCAGVAEITRAVKRTRRQPKSLSPPSTRPTGQRL